MNAPACQERQAACPPVAEVVWHQLSPDSAAERLGVEPQRGVTPQDAEQRAAVYGHNEIREQRQRTLWRMFCDQFADVMIIILMIAAGVSGVIGELLDASVILIIVVLNATIGFIQEYRAERAVAALKQLAAPHATVQSSRKRCRRL